MLKRVESAKTALNPMEGANLRVEYQSLYVTHTDGKNYMTIGKQALQHPAWPFLRETAHGILLATRAGNTERADALSQELAAFTHTDGHLVAMEKLAHLHAARFELISSKSR